MSFVFTFYLLFFFGGESSMASDEIAHKVIKEDGSIQIREYKPSVKAVVEIKSSRSEATSKAFRILFNFIRGNNISSKEISMTTPVSQTSSQEIAMTTPVSQEKLSKNLWSVAFYMPNKMSFEETPKPKDKRITIKKVPARKMIAIKFSGRSTDSNIYEHEKELLNYIKKNDISTTGDAIYAFYSAPFVPWFLRRNEVLYELN